MIQESYYLSLLFYLSVSGCCIIPIHPSVKRDGCAGIFMLLSLCWYLYDGILYLSRETESNRRPIAVRVLNGLKTLQATALPTELSRANLLHLVHMSIMTPL